MITAFRIDVTDQAVKLWIIDFFAAVIERIKYAWKVKYSKVTHEGNLRSCVLYNKRNVSVSTGFK